MSFNLNTQMAPSFYPRSASSESPVFSAFFSRDTDGSATDSSTGMSVPVEFTFHPLDPASGLLQGDAATLDTLFDPASLKPGCSFPLDPVMPDGRWSYYWSEQPQTGYLMSTNVDPTGVAIGIPCVIAAGIFAQTSSVLPSIPGPQWGFYATANFTSDVRTMNPQRVQRNSLAISESTNSLELLHYGSENQTFHDVNVLFRVDPASMNGFPASDYSGSVNLTIGAVSTPVDPEIGWDYHLVRRVEATPGSAAHIEVLPQADNSNPDM
ncbi:hypothetical protein JCM24511_02799 [Saitozyma sp. JCM 24511]|nr:hypothetical protein JCM24511_02799 [Saitozyma sp. JCM 24511]